MTKTTPPAQETLSRSQARRIALAAQGFGAKQGAGDAGWRRMRGAIERMGLLQIDSVSALVRSHYLPVFSRVGAYDPALLDRKAFHPKKRALFEYWAHEASLLPLALHPLLRWRMARAAKGQGIYQGYARFARERRDYVADVLAQIRDEGPLTPRELRNPGKRGKGMWVRNDGKIALEYLFWVGEVTAATRRGFERVYDLTERTLPADVLDLPTPPEEEAQCALLRIAAKALGVATEADLRDYFRLPAATAKRRVAELAEAGDIVPIRVEGWRQQAYLDPEARLPRWVRGAALLSPFDPLIWERSRTERLFDFHYRLEIYTPAAKRRHGYYVLPFLLDGRLVARVDLKADRAAGVLRALANHGEADIEAAEVAPALMDSLERMAAWLGLERVSIGRRGDLAPALRRQRR
ncbi:MAG: winged helix DNA-binding domain-containing protein [Kiloniellales bacterium]|nr:winged helix DNA-binding domain-containing protein [Kiloniellales bacterium]